MHCNLAEQRDKLLLAVAKPLQILLRVGRAAVGGGNAAAPLQELWQWQTTVTMDLKHFNVDM